MIIMIYASSKAPNVGDTLNMECSVCMLEFMLPNLTIQWSKVLLNESLLLEGTQTGFMSLLSISSLNTSDAGQYTCTGSVLLDDASNSVRNKASHNLILRSKFIDCLN